MSGPFVGDEIYSNRATVHADRMTVNVGHTGGKPSTRRRSITIDEKDGGARIVVVLSPKGRDVSVTVEGVTFYIGVGKMRRAAKRGIWEAMDFLRDLGWRSPDPEDDQVDPL